ncbi:unnamed protein product, partial [Rotaria sordida]
VRDQYEKSQYDLEQAIKDRDITTNKFKHVLDQLHDLERQVPELRKKADDERAKKEAAVNKLQEIVTNPMQHNPFYSRPTGGSRRHDRNERNVVRRLEQALAVERMKYTKLQHEKDEEVAVLLEDISKLKRELEIRRDEIEKFTQQLESRTSIDNISSIAEEVDDDTKDYIESWVQTPKKSNIQKYGWKKQLAVMKKNRLLLYNSEKDQQPAVSIDIDKLYHVRAVNQKSNIQKYGWKKQLAVMKKNRLLLYNSEKDQQPAVSIDIDKLYHVRAVNQGDVLHVDPSIIPKIFQIIYDSQGNSIPNVLSSSVIHSQEQDRHNGESIEYKGHNFVVVTYRMRTECEVCNHPCYNLISPPQCLQCTRCRVRCHKQHYDDGEFIQPCRVYDTLTVKELLVMCSSEKEQKQWITKLSTKVPRPPLSQTDSLRKTKKSSKSLHKSATLPTKISKTYPANNLPSDDGDCTASFRSQNTSMSSSTSNLFGNNAGLTLKQKSSTLPNRAK